MQSSVTSENSMPMGAWGGDNAPGRSRANRPTMRNPHPVRPPDDRQLLGAYVCLSRLQGPATDMGRMEQLNYRGRSLADGKWQIADGTP